MPPVREQLFRPEVVEQQAYPVENIACRIKLDANENPYPLPMAVRRRFLKRLQEMHLNRYPDAGAPEVVKRLASHYGVADNMIMAGNGSDELIAILCTALGGEETCVLVPSPTFPMYRISALNNGHNVVSVPLDDCFDLDTRKMLDVIEKQSPSIIFLSYPNNPTGNCFSQDRMETIIRESRGLVVVDEAYSPFSGKTLLPYMKTYKNLVVLKTLSKVGLAAIRLGFLIANPEVIHELNKVRLPYNLNTLSQIAALFYLDEEPVFKGQIHRIVEERGRLFRELKNIDGIVPYPSEANFIFFSCTYDVNIVYHKLIGEGVLVKPFMVPGWACGCIRVAVGARDENDIFIKVLKSIIAEVRGVI